METEMPKEDSEFVQEFIQESSFRRTVSIQPRFLRRRLDLIVRDPLAIEAVKEADKLPLPIDEWTPKIQDLVAKLEKKWNVTVLFTRDQKYRFELAGRKYDNMIDPDGIRPLVMWMKGKTQDQAWVGRDIERIWFYRIDASNVKEYQIDSLINCVAGDRFPSDDKLFIMIDLNLVDLNDARLVKQTVWSITKEYLAKRKKEGKKKRILDEPKELLFIYDCREQTFQNYLRWYDIHTREKLGFRLIAFLNEICKGDNIKYEKWLEGLRSKKWKVGRSIKGEDSVGKGVKVIWAAIHRESYNREKAGPVIEEWNCPVHGNGYSPTCKDCKALHELFNRTNSMNKGYSKAMPQADIDFLYYERIGRLPKRRRSSKSDDIQPKTPRGFQFPQYSKIK